VKHRALALLRRLHLVRPAFWVYESYLAARASWSERGRSSPDGLPLPPPRLRVAVAGTADLDWFLEGGRRAAESIREALGPGELERLGALLDFGCGCGRVVRNWSSLGQTRVEGTDSDARAVKWCSENLTFAGFRQNGLEPPLDFEDESFDLIYALSVFTHIPGEWQRPWLDELRRLLRPGGRLLITTQGDAYRDHLAPDERKRYEAGHLVVRDATGAGSNLCTVFHPPEVVRRETAQGFELERFEPSGAKGNPVQDLVLLRVPAR
jgi:SAM-dependent methyltransferase